MSEPRKPKARVVEPDRSQGVMKFEVLDEILSATHPARLIDQVVGTLDLSLFTDGSTAVEGHAGPPTKSPRMKLTLWLYGISRRIGSSREIARRTLQEDAFRWIVGDQSISHDALSSFRVNHGAALENLMTDVLASLLHKGLLSLALVAQDGTRVRASASGPSFRSYGSLLQCRQQAALHLKAVLADADNPEHTAAQHAARKAAAEDYQQRVEKAIETVVQLQEQKAKASSPSRREKVARASTTDAEARVMKMGDGGFRPAYNIQLATAGSEEGGPRTIVGVKVTNLGSDVNSVAPMLDQIERRTGKLPAVLLADTQHAARPCIENAVQRGVNLLVAVPENSGHQRRKTSQEVIDWRARMETDEAQRLYRARAGLIELTNAHIKERLALDHVLVRGLAKVTCVALLTGLTFNILQNLAGLLS